MVVGGGERGGFSYGGGGGERGGFSYSGGGGVVWRRESLKASPFNH